MPLTPVEYVLSLPQHIPFHYVMTILANMEPVPTEFLEEERDDYEQYYVNEFIFFKMHFLHYIIYNEKLFCLFYVFFHLQFSFIGPSH